jgi:RNA polymerase sigma factor (sigma-70 family)
MGKLFERALRGDTSALAEIDGIIRRIARAECRRGGPGSVDVDWEDVAQESARRFFTVGLRQYAGDGSEESFLFAIVRSTVLQSVRSAARRRQREQAPVAADRPPSHPPDEHLDVRIILAKLPRDCAELLEKVFLQGVPYAELASELGMLESSVRVRVSRCLKKAMETAGGDSR